MEKNNNDSDEQRIEAIVDEFQSQPFQKYDVHLKITLKKEKEEKQNDGEKDRA